MADSIESVADFGKTSSFFQTVTTSSAAWTEVTFTGIDDIGFEASSIAFECPAASGDDAVFSFDPNPTAASKKIHGQLTKGNPTYFMYGKKATKVYIKRLAATDATVRVTAWR